MTNIEEYITKFNDDLVEDECNPISDNVRQLIIDLNELSSIHKNHFEALCRALIDLNGADYKIVPWKKKLWLESLRSGKYPQTQNFLKTASCDYCCLGVYAEVVDDVEWLDGGTYYYFEVDGGTYEGSLTHDHELSKVQSELISLNDDANLNFEQIALVVEKLL